MADVLSVDGVSIVVSASGLAVSSGVVVVCASPSMGAGDAGVGGETRGNRDASGTMGVWGLGCS